MVKVMVSWWGKGERTTRPFCTWCLVSMWIIGISWVFQISMMLLPPSFSSLWSSMLSPLAVFCLFCVFRRAARKVRIARTLRHPCHIEQLA